MKTNLKTVWTLVAAVALLGLQACGTTSVSKGLSDNGSASEVIFPDKAKDAWLKDGVFVNLDNLRAVSPGLNKDQLYGLLGRPHFSEGMGGVREWDYIFNFRTGKGHEFITCQYKVIFDKDYIGQTFHWAPESCARQLAEKTVVFADRPVEKLIPLPIQAPVPVILPKRMHLSADALFVFGKSELSDFLPGGQRELDLIASYVREAAQFDRMELLAYTDRLGSDAYNQQLSEARGRTVRDYLVSKGVPANKITSRGLGKRDPVVQCEPASQLRLIACLAPNRRIDIVIRELAKS